MRPSCPSEDARANWRRLLRTRALGEFRACLSPTNGKSKAIYATDVLIEAVPMTPDEWGNGESLIAEFAREGEEIPA